LVQKMCKNCVKTAFPQRERLCTETGVYIQNFAGCSKCNEQNRAPDSLISKGPGTIEEVDDDVTKEITAFDHTCTKCGHIIANHTHEFWIEDGYQEYRMECLICGLGEDSISILPKDPRKVSQILF